MWVRSERCLNWVNSHASCWDGDFLVQSVSDLQQKQLIIREKWLKNKVEPKKIQYQMSFLKNKSMSTQIVACYVKKSVTGFHTPLLRIFYLAWILLYNIISMKIGKKNHVPKFCFSRLCLILQHIASAGTQTQPSGMLYWLTYEITYTIKGAHSIKSNTAVICYCISMENYPSHTSVPNML